MALSLKRSYVRDGHKKCFVAVKQLLPTLGGKKGDVSAAANSYTWQMQMMAGRQGGIDVIHFSISRMKYINVV